MSNFESFGCHAAYLHSCSPFKLKFNYNLHFNYIFMFVNNCIIILTGQFFKNNTVFTSPLTFHFILCFEAYCFPNTFRNYHCTLARGCTRVPAEIYDSFCLQFQVSSCKPAPNMCPFKYKSKSAPNRSKSNLKCRYPNPLGATPHIYIYIRPSS